MNFSKNPSRFYAVRNFLRTKPLRLAPQRPSLRSVGQERLVQRVSAPILRPPVPLGSSGGEPEPTLGFLFPLNCWLVQKANTPSLLPDQQHIGKKNFKSGTQVFRFFGDTSVHPRTHKRALLSAESVYPSLALPREPSCSRGGRGGRRWGSANLPHALHVAQPLKYCSRWTKARSQSLPQFTFLLSPPPAVALSLLPSLLEDASEDKLTALHFFPRRQEILCARAFPAAFDSFLTFFNLQPQLQRLWQSTAQCVSFVQLVRDTHTPLAYIERIVVFMTPQPRYCAFRWQPASAERCKQHNADWRKQHGHIRPQTHIRG